MQSNSMWAGAQPFFELLRRGCNQASHLHYRSVSSGKSHNRKTDTPDATPAYLQTAQNSHDKLLEIHVLGYRCVTHPRECLNFSVCAVGLPPRGDSFQSDSSGYAEEDLHPLA